MDAFPHRYVVGTTGRPTGEVTLHADGLATLPSASPAEFDGPGDLWSPETLLVGAIGDCLILTFGAVARASGLPWTSLECDVTGTLDRVEKVTRFTAFEIRARLVVPTGTDPERATRLLEKSERACLITNSLNAAVTLVPTIEVG
ncbi:MAG: OsmC family protein [Acidobacteria bacterium]|nr:OsmC family protein [Acidobacteriota bacterium]